MTVGLQVLRESRPSQTQLWRSPVEDRRRPGRRRCRLSPVSPSGLPGPPDPSYGRLNRQNYSENNQNYIAILNVVGRISWDIRQLSSSHCISFFLLKYWHSSDFVPQHTTLKFGGGGSHRKTYEGVMEVTPCTTYTYVLTMAFSASKTSDIQGRSSLLTRGVWSVVQGFIFVTIIYIIHY